MTDLTDRFETPFYVYDLSRVRNALDALRRSLPDRSKIFYSVKANPHPRLVSELVRAGLDCEVSSVGELRAALAGGQSPAECLYSGPGKTREEIAFAITAGVRQFSVESVVEVGRLASVAERHEVDIDYLVRLNGRSTAGGAGLRMTGVSSQFGIPLETARKCPELFRSSGRLRPVGLHVFPATNVPGDDALCAEFDSSMATIAGLLAETPLKASLIDLGGGFAAPYARPGSRPTYRQLRARLEASLDESFSSWRSGDPQVAFESGRYLVADCGTLVTRVLDIKESGDTAFAVLDAGTNVLGGMSGLGRILPLAQPAQEPDHNEPAVHERFTLAGPLCTPLDVLSRAARLSRPRVGDVLSIPNVGAYGLTASLVSFLSRPMPLEIVVEGDGSVVSVRQLEIREKELGA